MNCTIVTILWSIIGTIMLQKVKATRESHEENTAILLVVYCCVAGIRYQSSIVHTYWPNIGAKKLRRAKTSFEELSGNFIRFSFSRSCAVSSKCCISVDCLNTFARDYYILVNVLTRLTASSFLSAIILFCSPVLWWYDLNSINPMSAAVECCSLVLPHEMENCIVLWSLFNRFVFCGE